MRHKQTPPLAVMPRPAKETGFHVSIDSGPTPLIQAHTLEKTVYSLLEFRQTFLGDILIADQIAFGLFRIDPGQTEILQVSPFDQ